MTVMKAIAAGGLSPTCCSATGDGAMVRFELNPNGGIRHRPGADDAIAAGCLCDPVRNNAGRGGAARDDGVAFIFRRDCPVHLQIPIDPAGES